MSGLAVVVVLGVIVMTLARRSSASGGAIRLRPGGPERGDDLRAVLDRAVAAGHLTSDQADTILAAERSEPEGRPVPPVPPVLEALGYMGGTLVLLGAVILVSGFWDELAAWSRLLVLGAAAVGLTAAGLALHDEDEPVTWRLRGFVLLLGSGALAGFTAVLAADGFDVAGAPVAVLTGIVVAGDGLVLWRRRDRPAQQLTCLAGLVAASAGAVVWLGGGEGVVGIVLWLLGVVWLEASRRKLLPPPLVGIALGAGLALVAGSVSSNQWQHAGVLFGLATALALMAVGIRSDEFVVTGLGVIGTFAYLPPTIALFFRGTIGVPAAMMASGAALLASAMLLLRRRERGPTGRADRRPSPGALG